MCRRGTVQGLFWPYETPILQEHLRRDDRGEPKGDDEVLEAIQVLGDGEINWVIATLIVAPRGRNRGINTALIIEAFERAGANRLDLFDRGRGAALLRSLARASGGGLPPAPLSDPVSAPFASDPSGPGRASGS